MQETLTVQSQEVPGVALQRQIPDAYYDFSDLVKKTLFPAMVNLHSVGLAMGIDADNVRCLVADRVVRFYEGDGSSPLVTDEKSLVAATTNFYEEEEDEDAFTTEISTTATDPSEEPEPF